MKKDETTGAEYPSKSDSNFCNSQLMPKILPDDEIVEGINSLNLTKRKVFDVVHTWANKNYVNCDGMMLNQCIYFFQAVEEQVNLIF